MIRWIVHFTVAAAFAQAGCRPTERAAPGQSETADQEIDGTQLVRVGTRMRVVPAFTGTAVWRYPNGNRRTARTFKNGILEGPMVSWYDDGQTKSYSVTYKANKKDVFSDLVPAKKADIKLNTVKLKKGVQTFMLTPNNKKWGKHLSIYNVTLKKK